MRSSSLRYGLYLAVALLAVSARGNAQINPQNQVRWPTCFGSAKFYDIPANTCDVAAPGTGITLQLNGVDLAVQTLLNFDNTTPAPPAGYVNCTFQSDGSGHLSSACPSATNQFSQFVQFPTTSYSTYFLYPTVGTATNVTCTAVATPIGGIVPSCGTGSSAYITWSGFTLPAGIPQSSIHAIIPFMVGYGYDGPIPPAYPQMTQTCTGGGGTFFATPGNVFNLGTYTMGAVGSPTSFNFSTATCVATTSNSLPLQQSGGAQVINGIGYYIEYTGTPIPQAAVNVVPPLSYDPTNGTLSLPIPYDFAADTNVSTLNAYQIVVPAIQGIQPGTEIKFLPFTANTSTTPTLNLTDASAVPYGAALIIKCANTALVANDIDPIGRSGTYTGIADVIWDGQFWELQNPQTGCGSGGGGGSGTVTSVALIGSNNLFKTPAGTPVTTAGNLNMDSQLASQVANCVIAGPASGGSTAPTCRALVSLDIPNNAANTTGNALTATTAGKITTTGSNGQFWGVSGGTQGWYTPSGGGASFPLRGGNSATGSSASTILLPAGSAIGDLVVLAIGCENASCSPTSGSWTTLNTQSGGFWGGGAFSETLTSGEITNGYINVTYNGGPGATGILVFSGNPGAIRETDVTYNVASAPASAATSTSSAVLSTDYLVAIGTCRCSAAPTIAPVTVQATNASNSSATTYGQPSWTGGVNTVDFNYTGLNPQGLLQYIVVVQ